MPKFGKANNTGNILLNLFKSLSGTLLIIPYQLTKFQALGHCHKQVVLSALTCRFFTLCIMKFSRFWLNVVDKEIKVHHRVICIFPMIQRAKKTTGQCEECYLFTTMSPCSSSLCVMKKRDLFAMKDTDLKFTKLLNFPCQQQILEIRQCYTVACMDFYLWHTLIIFSGNTRLILKSVLKLEKVPFSPQQHILNCLDTYSLKTNSNV